MFRRNTTTNEPQQPAVQAVERITSVLGSGVIWHGSINGTGGVRIEGAFEGEIALRGMLVVGETGRVTCQNVRANTVIVAGAVRGNITTQKLERARSCADRSAWKKRSISTLSLLPKRRLRKPPKPNPSPRRRSSSPNRTKRKKYRSARKRRNNEADPKGLGTFRVFLQP
jgi:hypothetical protein